MTSSSVRGGSLPNHESLSDESRKRPGEHYDRFRERLIFPIRNAAGRLVGFGGRALGDDDVKSGAHNDLVLGDHGLANFDAAGRLTDATTTSPGSGGRDASFERDDLLDQLGFRLTKARVPDSGRIWHVPLLADLFDLGDILLTRPRPPQGKRGVSLCDP